MDPVTIEKFQAMKRYKKTKHRHTLLQYFFTALVLSVCISKALCFPSSLFSSAKLFFSISLPDIGVFFVSPKCLFIVCNVIIIFLVGESKLAGPSSPNSEIYNDYVQHRQRLRRQPSCVYVKEKENNSVFCVGKRADGRIEQVKEEGGEGARGQKEEEVKERGGEGEAGEEEENGGEVDELKRRAEDFIARVNRQRRLEAQMPD